MTHKIKLKVTEGTMLAVLIEISKDNFKQDFLKRWGNIVKEGTNKGQKERQIIKNIVYSSTNVNEMLKEINSNTRWKVEIER